MSIGYGYPIYFSSFIDNTMFGVYDVTIIYTIATDDKFSVSVCTECEICEKMSSKIDIIGQLKNI